MDLKERYKVKKELEAFRKYIAESGSMFYFGDGKSAMSFGEKLKPEYFFCGEAPDFYIKENDNVLIMEHFEFDCYKVTKKGSEHRREEARIQRREDAIKPTESGTTLHDVIHGDSSYDYYIENVKRSFLEHYSKIDTYILNLTKAGVINKQSVVKVVFFIEDVSPLGTTVFKREGPSDGLIHVTLSDSREFLDLLKENDRVDYVLACSSYDNKQEVWFIDREQLNSYYENVIDYSSMQFLRFQPHVVAYKVQVPNETAHE